MTKHLLAALLAAFSLAASAGGTIEIVGRLNAFSDKKIDVTDGRNVYTIDRKKLSAQQAAMVKGKSPGYELRLQLPFDAITEVKKLVPVE